MSQPYDSVKLGQSSLPIDVIPGAFRSGGRQVLTPPGQASNLSVSTIEKSMKFFITARDMSGSVTLERETVPAALKKAGELLSVGYFNVEIVMPDGAAYHPGEFDQLRERVGIALGG